MNKLERIKEILHGEPVLYDIYCYEKEWTIEELNQLMLAEYLEEIKVLATKMDRSVYAMVLKYLDLREDLDKTLAFDIKLWEGEQDESLMYQFEEWDTDEFTKGVSVANMKVGEILEVLVRIVDPKLRENIPSELANRWSHFMTVSPDGGGGGLFGGTRVMALELGHADHDPDKWGILRFKANKVGPIQIGMALREKQSDEWAISKTMLVNITE